MLFRLSEMKCTENINRFLQCPHLLSARPVPGIGDSVVNKTGKVLPSWATISVNTEAIQSNFPKKAFVWEDTY